MEYYEFACMDFEERVDVFFRDAYDLFDKDLEEFEKVGVLSMYISTIELERDLFMSRMNGTVVNGEAEREVLWFEINRLMSKCSESLSAMGDLMKKISFG